MFRCFPRFHFCKFPCFPWFSMVLYPLLPMLSWGIFLQLSCPRLAWKAWKYPYENHGICSGSMLHGLHGNPWIFPHEIPWFFHGFPMLLALECVPVFISLGMNLAKLRLASVIRTEQSLAKLLRMAILCPN